MYINIYFWGRPPVPEGCDLCVGGLVARIQIRFQDIYSMVVGGKSTEVVFKCMGGNSKTGLGVICVMAAIGSVGWPNPGELVPC